MEEKKEINEGLTEVEGENKKKDISKYVWGVYILGVFMIIGYLFLRDSGYLG